MSGRGFVVGLLPAEARLRPPRDQARHSADARGSSMASTFWFITQHDNSMTSCLVFDELDRCTSRPKFKNIPPLKTRSIEFPRPLYIFGENQLYRRVEGMEWLSRLIFRATGMTLPIVTAKFGLPQARTRAFFPQKMTIWVHKVNRMICV